MLGTNRQSIRKVPKEWKQNELIERLYGTIKLCDMDAPETLIDAWLDASGAIAFNPARVSLACLPKHACQAQLVYQFLNSCAGIGLLIKKPCATSHPSAASASH